jgi:lysophospholipase L1-like esterase
MKWLPFWCIVLFVLAVLVVVVPLARQKSARGSAPDPAPVPAATLSAPPEAIVDAAVVEAEAKAVAVAEAPRARVAWPDAVKSVLHVGDSSLGYEQGLALELGTRFKAIGVHYFPETYTNAALHTFATSRTLEQLVQARKPDVVLLSLGMNNLTVANPEAYERDVRSLVEQIGDRPCWWIGPLTMPRPDHGLIAMLARSTAPCRWTSSYELVIERQPDAIHPTQRGAASWANAIWTAIGAPSPKP